MDENENDVSDRPVGPVLLSAVLLQALAFALLFAVSEPFYQTNDDPAMHLRSAGIFLSQSPTEFILFSHVLVGLVLKWLYSAMASVPWYPLNLLLTHAAAGIAIAWLLMRRFGQREGAARALLYFVLIQSYFFWNMQFTSVAAMGSVTGMLLWLECESNRARAVATALLLWACMIRPEGFLVAAAVTLPLALTHLLDRARRPATLLFLALVGICSLAIPWTNRAYYEADAEWSNFLTRNGLRARFTDSRDFTPQTLNYDELDGMPIDGHDVTAFSSWLLDEAEDLTSENVRALDDLREEGPAAKTRLSRRQVLRALEPGLAVKSAAMVLVAFVLAAWRGRIALLAASSGCITLLSWLALVAARAPDRVVSSALACLAVVALVELERPREPRRWWRTLATFLSVVLLLVGLSETTRHFRQNLQKQTTSKFWHQTLEQLRVCETQVCFWPRAADLRSTRPFDDWHALYGGLRLLGGASNSLTQDYERTKKEFGVTHLYPEMLERSDLLVIRPAKSFVRGYVQYMSGRYGIDVKPEVVLGTERKPVAVRFVKDPGVDHMGSDPTAPRDD